MKNNRHKIYVLVAFTGAWLLSACAGSPPAWWDPSGTYRAAEVKTDNSVLRAPTQTLPAAAAQQVPAEEKIDSQEEDYEEMQLAPLTPDTAQDSAEK